MNKREKQAIENRIKFALEQSANDVGWVSLSDASKITKIPQRDFGSCGIDRVNFGRSKYCWPAQVAERAVERMGL